MKTFFISSDIHSFYKEWMNSLKEAGFDKLNKDHYLIVLGDLFDRGDEPDKIISFIKEMDTRAILIRGNHEDLFESLVERGLPDTIDYYNGTYDTLTKLFNKPMITIDEYKNSDLYKYVISKMVDYIESDHYIFTHGFIPIIDDGSSYKYDPSWRASHTKKWENARWLNGMEYGETYIKDFNGLNKKIVVGHYTTEYGHKVYENDYSNNHNIFYGNNVIALDSTTVLSKKVNVLVLKENEM